VEEHDWGVGGHVEEMWDELREKESRLEKGQ
jgi:hypothetical protein